MNIKDIMNSENKSQTFAVLMVIGIIIVVLGLVYYLIIIWSSVGESDETEVKKQLELGEYEQKIKTDDDMAKYYYTCVFGDLVTKNYESLYEKLDNAYAVQYKITKDNLKQYIEKKGIADLTLVLEKYEKEKLEDYNCVYKLYVKTAASTAIEKIIVKEKSPNDYVVAFDGYLSFDKLGGGKEKEGLKFTLQDMNQVGSQITIKMYIKNVTAQNVTLNKNKETYAIKALTNNNKLISTISDTISRREVILQPEQEFSYTAVFSKTENFDSIIGINIVDVFYEDSKLSSAVTYEF